MIKNSKQEDKLGGATYPKRPSYWAMKLIRLLSKCCAAQDITPTGYTLLAVIATTEDAAGYRRAVTYYDGQLAPIVGVSQKSLAIIRRRCVDAGWLHYAPGGKGRAARYWTTIPTHASDIDDHASDEGDDDPPPMRRKSDDESGMNRERIGEDATWQRANILPIPIPDPIPIPKKEPPNPHVKSGGTFLTPPSADFERFWEAYPKKIKRREACDQWEAAIAVVQSQTGMTRGAAVEWIIGKARELSASALALHAPQFLPGAAAFLKDERFFDDVNEWNTHNSKPETDLFASLRRFNKGQTSKPETDLFASFTRFTEGQT